MLVIPDTSAFEEDLRLESVQWRLLLENAAAANLTIAVPRVVFREVTNRFREKINKHITSVNNTLAALSALTGKKLQSPIKADDPQHWLRWFRYKLRERILGRGGQILKIPRISHATLISRDLRRRKPFTESGRGYRDALLWETILQAVRDGQPNIAFICENTRDFAGPDRKHFHSDLIQDLTKLGVEESVLLFDRLTTFIEEKLWPALPKPHRDFLDLTREQFPDFSLEEQLEQFLLNALPGRQMSPRDLGTDHVFEEPTITMVDRPVNVQIIDEAEPEGKQRVLELEAEVECLFDSFIDKFEYYTMSDQRQPSATEWNETYMKAEFYATLRVRGYATFDPADGVFTDFEITELIGQDVIE